MENIEATQEKKSQKMDYTPVQDYGKVARRSFLSWSALGWIAFTGANAIGGGILLRFMFPNVLFEPPQVFKAGKPEDYEPDKPDERFKQAYGVWMVNLTNDVIDNRKCMVALSTVCTHLGCTPNVLLSEQKIKCPCHGSGFRFTGINFEGPAPRPLERYRVVVDPVDGQIIVDKTKKYQHEKGEWENPESFLPI